jgi:hypothetical protein
MINVVLWLVGAVLVAVSVWRIPRPYGRLAELDRLADNARRYESWRGVRGGAGEDRTTGADVMRQLLRREVIVWAAVGIVGLISVFAGFAIR